MPPILLYQSSHCISYPRVPSIPLYQPSYIYVVTAVLLHTTTHRVPGEIKRREVELDPQVSPEEIKRREMELGCESWTSFASGCSSTAVQLTLSLWLCPVETAIAQCTSRCAMARGHRLNISIVLAAVHGLSGLFRAVSAVEPSLSGPLPPCSRP